MSKTAVYINTSLWEGLSKAVIEACAVGMPLILRNVTGNRDLLYIGADARMFDIMSEAVKLIRQSLSVESISRSCVVNTEIAKKFFSPNAHLYESLYQANAIKF
jgi:glycosyltransferase involved in cell wall biosynthesis